MRQSDAAVGCLATREPKRSQETERDDLGLGRGDTSGYPSCMANPCLVYVEFDFSHGILVHKKHPKTQVTGMEELTQKNVGRSRPKVLADCFLTTDAFVAAAPFLLSLAQL